MSTFLVWLQMFNLESQIDWIITRYHRLVEWYNLKLWKAGLADKVPPSELDLTALLDEADFKNKQMDAFK